MIKFTETIKCDALIIGAGLAGMRAALEISKNFSTVLLGKVHPLRSHTDAAQGGIAAALGNVEDDSIENHFFDTVKGSDYLGDQDAQEILVSEAPTCIYELEHFGTPFSRTEEGKIAQRSFGGHSKKRACYVADLTGHAILHTLYEQVVKENIKVYPEHYVISLLGDKERITGAVVYDMTRGEMKLFHANTVLLATGGYARCFQLTSNDLHNTGDGLSLVWRLGVPLEDMEFVQFHPTGLYRQGILVTEAARGEGGYLLNKEGKRFMEHYAPKTMELAPRDVVSRSMQTEIDEGRGIDGKDYIFLDLRHLGKEKIIERLPQIHDLALNFVGVDCVKEPIPIQPVAHYSMGGIPTDIDGRVLKDGINPVNGLFAAGECSCVSVHGANRLGCNSLLDAVVFGRRAGRAINEFLENNRPIPQTPSKNSTLRLDEIMNIYNGLGEEKIPELRRELQRTMGQYCGVFRHETFLTDGLNKIKELQERYKKVGLIDKSSVFNSELIETLELGHMLEYCEVIVASALNRKESRGSHYRKDFPKRDDNSWLKHTLAFSEEGKIRFEYKPVKITKYPPAERKY